RKEDAESAQFCLSLEERGEREAHVYADDSAQHPVRNNLAGIWAERRGRQQAEETEGEAHQRGFDRTAPLSRPIDVIEVQDQRELVQRERCADTEEGGEQE